MSFDTELGGVALPTFGDEQQGDGLVRIQWRNGEPKLKTGGRFFVSGDRLPDGYTPGAPWLAVTETFESGDDAEGFAAESLSMAVLCARAQPFYWEGDNGSRHKVWLTKWERGREHQSMQVEVLALVEGMEDLGPVVWTSATIKTSFAIIGRGGKGEAPGILALIDQMMVAPASKAAGQKLDRYAFWARVATEKDDKGKVVYTETPGKKVTRPVLDLPPIAGRTIEWLRTIYVGTDLLRDTLIPLREQYEPWRQEQRTNDEAPPAPVKAQAGDGRNVPQPIEDEFVV